MRKAANIHDYGLSRHAPPRHQGSKLHEEAWGIFVT